MTVLKAKWNVPTVDGKRKINIRAAEGHDARVARLNNRFLLNHLNLSKDYIITAHGRIVAKDRDDEEGGTHDANAEGEEVGIEPDEGTARGALSDNTLISWETHAL